MTKQIEIIFSNVDAADHVIDITVGSMQEADHVMAWYGAFYAGDDYDVIIDGEYQALDGNGNRAALQVQP